MAIPPLRRQHAISTETCHDHGMLEEDRAHVLRLDDAAKQRPSKNRGVPKAPIPDTSAPTHLLIFGGYDRQHRVGSCQGCTSVNTPGTVQRPDTQRLHLNIELWMGRFSWATRRISLVCGPGRGAAFSEESVDCSGLL